MADIDIIRVSLMYFKNHLIYNFHALLCVMDLMADGYIYLDIKIVV